MPTTNGCLFLRGYSVLRSGMIPAELGQLRSLQELRLSQNDLEGKAAKFWLYQTRSISFHFAFACACTRVRALLLLMGILAGCLNLVLIRVYHPFGIAGSIPWELSRLSALRELLLNRCMLSGAIPSQFGKLQSLERLNLYSNRLTGEYEHEPLMSLECSKTSNLVVVGVVCACNYAAWACFRWLFLRTICFAPLRCDALLHHT